MKLPALLWFDRPMQSKAQLSAWLYSGDAGQAPQVLEHALLGWEEALKQLKPDGPAACFVCIPEDSLWPPALWALLEPQVRKAGWQSVRWTAVWVEQACRQAGVNSRETLGALIQAYLAFDLAQQSEGAFKGHADVCLQDCPSRLCLQLPGYQGPLQRKAQARNWLWHQALDEGSDGYMRLHERHGQTHMEFVKPLNPVEQMRIALTCEVPASAQRSATGLPLDSTQALPALRTLAQHTGQSFVETLGNIQMVVPLPHEQLGTHWLQKPVWQSRVRVSATLGDLSRATARQREELMYWLTMLGRMRGMDTEPLKYGRTVRKWAREQNWVWLSLPQYALVSRHLPLNVSRMHLYAGPMTTLRALLPVAPPVPALAQEVNAAARLWCHYWMQWLFDLRNPWTDVMALAWVQDDLCYQSALRQALDQGWLEFPETLQGHPGDSRTGR